MSKIRNKRKTLPLTLEKEYYKEIIRKICQYFQIFR